MPAAQTQELLQGTLDVLVLKILDLEPNHGWGISRRLRQMSADGLTTSQGSLYPALQRMLIKGWVSAEWGQSDNNRRARYYRLTPLGRKQLSVEISEFERVMEAIARVIQPA